MIIKKMDSKQEEIAELTALLRGRLIPYQRFLIERELKAIRSGVSGEKDSAYYIDFYFGDSKNWAVIHDLRLEHKGQVAQIDHLMINRFLDMYVLESKNYSYKLKITPERRPKGSALDRGQTKLADSKRNLGSSGYLGTALIFFIK